MASGRGLDNTDEEAAVQDTDWLMRIRVRSAELLRERSPVNDSEMTAVLSGLLEDLQSAFDIAKDAYPMFALTYTLRRNPESQTEGDGHLVEMALDAIGDAIANEQGLEGDGARLYRMGFMNGTAAAVKNIHMNA